MHRLNLLLPLTVLFIILSTQALKAESSDVGSLGSQEVSLQGDKAELEKLRKDIPQDVKRENDDLGFILKLFEDKNRKPSKIKTQFNRSFNRLRKKKQQEFKKIRKEYTKAEKKVRKKFIADEKQKRKKFLDDKPSRDAKKSFFDEERTRRKDFFADEKLKRRDFEADIRAKRKDFDDYLKDRRRDFDDRYRQFVKDQREMKQKKKRLQQQRVHQSATPAGAALSPQNQKYLDDFKKIPRKGGVRLVPPQDGQ